MELVFAALWIGCGIASVIVAQGKNVNGCGAFLLGIFLGPIGLAIVLILPAHKAENKSSNHDLAQQTRKCPFCAEPIKREAIKCKHCGSQIEAVPEQPIPEGEAQSGSAPLKTNYKGMVTLIALVLGIMVCAVIIYQPESKDQDEISPKKISDFASHVQYIDSHVTSLEYLYNRQTQVINGSLRNTGNMAISCTVEAWLGDEEGTKIGSAMVILSPNVDEVLYDIRPSAGYILKYDALNIVEAFGREVAIVIKPFGY
jgi:hypothetical protein